MHIWWEFFKILAMQAKSCMGIGNVSQNKIPTCKDIRKLVEPIIKHRLGFPSYL